jgi:apolipoprotein D and lipocalin family protein
MRNFQISDMMGFWYVIQYYASSEELSEYSCMSGLFSTTDAMQASVL